MSSCAEQRLDRFLIVAIPATILVIGCGASLLPWRIVFPMLNLLTAWIALSFPVGLLVGHCISGYSTDK
jgi:hypothetical protein